MPRALEIVDAIVRQIERGEVTALEAIDAMLVEEFTVRENRRIKTALVMARLSTIKTLAGFDFAFEGGQFACNGVGSIPFTDESLFLLGCDRPVCLLHLQCIGVSSSETCGTFFGLFARRGKLAGERLVARS